LARQLASNRVTRVHTPRYLQPLALGSSRETVADRVAPRIPVPKQSDKYRIFGKNTMLVHESRWAPGAIPNAIRRAWSEAPFYADIRKLRGSCSTRSVATRTTTGSISSRRRPSGHQRDRVSREKRVADLFTTAGNYAATHKITKSGGSEWDSATALATRRRCSTCRRWCEGRDRRDGADDELTVVIPEPVYLTALQNNAGILARVQYSQTGVVTTDLLKTLLNVKEVIFSAR
jgi:hypothetical protein